LFHGAGSANIGAMKLLTQEVGVPKSQIFVTNSRGVVWKSADGTDGSFRNEEQALFAQIGKPEYNGRDLAEVIKAVKPTCLIGAVGRDPGCFNKPVIEALVEATKPHRPVLFALSNPKTQAECTSEECYKFSGGVAIYGSGTKMESVEVNGEIRSPAQVNNVYIFPGLSFGAIQCKASKIPESFFLAAAEAVAGSLAIEDLKADRVVPHLPRIRQVGLNVAAAVVMEAQKLNLAGKVLGSTLEEVTQVLQGLMWVPSGGQELHDKAVAVTHQVAGAHKPTKPTASRAVARGLFMGELNDYLGDTGIRSLKVGIDKKRPRWVADGSTPITNSLSKDFVKIEEMLKASGKDPCALCVRLQDVDNTLVGAKETDWIIITYIPEGLKNRDRMTWQGAGDTFITNYPEKRVAEWRINSADEVSHFAFIEVAKSVFRM